MASNLNWNWRYVLLNWTWIHKQTCCNINAIFSLLGMKNETVMYCIELGFEKWAKANIEKAYPRNYHLSTGKSSKRHASRDKKLPSLVCYHKNLEWLIISAQFTASDYFWEWQLLLLDATIYQRKLFKWHRYLEHHDGYKFLPLFFIAIWSAFTL